MKENSTPYKCLLASNNLKNLQSSRNIANDLEKNKANQKVVNPCHNNHSNFSKAKRDKNTSSNKPGWNIAKNENRKYLDFIIEKVKHMKNDAKKKSDKKENYIKIKLYTNQYKSNDMKNPSRNQYSDEINVKALTKNESKPSIQKIDYNLLTRSQSSNKFNSKNQNKGKNSASNVMRNSKALLNNQKQNCKNNAQFLYEQEIL
jgi:hypothetical protein